MGKRELARMRPMQIQIEPKENHLLVRLTGRFELTKAEKMLSDIIDASLAHRLPHILIDSTDLDEEISILDRFEIGILLAENQLKDTCYAVLCRDEQLLPDNFLENVARNRGARLKVITTMGEALTWFETHRSYPTTA